MSHDPIPPTTITMRLGDGELSRLPSGDYLLTLSLRTGRLLAQDIRRRIAAVERERRQIARQMRRRVVDEDTFRERLAAAHSRETATKKGPLCA